MGLRGGRRHSDSWGWQVSIGLFDVADAAERTENRNRLSLDLFLVDASVVYHVADGRLMLFGGPGLAVAKLEMSGDHLGAIDESNSGFSLHTGIAYCMVLGDAAYLRLDGRLRYMDTDYYGGGVDGELTAAVGWSF